MSPCASMKQCAGQQSMWMGLGGKILAMLISALGESAQARGRNQPNPAWTLSLLQRGTYLGRTSSTQETPFLERMMAWLWSVPHSALLLQDVCLSSCPSDFQSAKWTCMWRWTLPRLWGSPAAITLEPLRISTSFLSNVTSTSTLSCTLHDSPLSVRVLFFFKEDKQKVLEGKRIDEVSITSRLQSKNFMSLIMTAQVR